MKNRLIALATVGILAVASADALGHGFRPHPVHRADVFGAAVLGGLLGGVIGSAIASPRYHAHEAPPRVIIERRHVVPHVLPPAGAYGGPSRYCYGATRYYDHGDGAPPARLGNYPRCED